jgi:hypothetical protein
VEPGREGGLAAELADLRAELGKGILGGIARILGIVEDVPRQPLDAGGMALAEGRKGARVTVSGTSHENRVTQPLVDELLLGP